MKIGLLLLRVLLQVLLRDQMLALPGRAEDERDRVRRCPGLDPAGERPAIRIRRVSSSWRSLPPCHRRHQHRNPPGFVAQRIIGVQHHPVHAAAGPGQQVPYCSVKSSATRRPVGPRGNSRQPDCPRTGHSFRAKSRTERRKMSFAAAGLANRQDSSTPTPQYVRTFGVCAGDNGTAKQSQY
jgi:hypothetical protein